MKIKPIVGNEIKVELEDMNHKRTFEVLLHQDMEGNLVIVVNQSGNSLMGEVFDLVYRTENYADLERKARKITIKPRKS